MSEGATEAVVEFILGANIEGFAEEVKNQGKRCMLDGVAVMLAGSAAECSAILRRHAQMMSGSEEATVLGREPWKVPAPTAALVNGTSGHALDYDDTQLSSSSDRIFGLLTHPTVPALASTLAVGEHLGSTGIRCLEAFLTGFEVECKIAEAIHPEHYRRGFHSSGTIGTFAAAACVAKLLGLDRDAVARSLGIAASLCSGIRTNFGTMTKPLHVGMAAQNGVVASRLASLGYSADRQGLDGRWGFFQVFGGGFDAERIIGRLGNPHNIVDPGVSVKPYPCGSLGHPTMDAMRSLVCDNDLAPESIRTIRVRAGVNILEPLRYGRATTELDAKFCIPFMVASIALRRRAGIREFTDDFVASEPVQRLMDRVEVKHDPEIEKRGFEKMRSVVEIHLDDGRRLERAAETYRGGPERPFSRKELHEKFHECAESVLPGEKIQRSIELIESVEKLGNIRELIGALS